MPAPPVGGDRLGASRPHGWRSVGIAAATGLALLVAAGWVGELWWLGASNDAAYARVRASVELRFADMVESLETAATSLAAQPEVLAGIRGDPDSQRELFGATRHASGGETGSPVALTVYAGAVARAWTGRPSEIPAERILGDRAFFVAPGPLGLRLVYIEPVLDPPDAGSGLARRLGSVAAERVLSPATGLADPSAGTFELSAPIADVAVRTRYEGAGALSGPRRFALRAPDGDVLLEAEVSDAELSAARDRWRRTVRSAVLTFLAVTLLLGTVPLLAWPPRDPSIRSALRVAFLATLGLCAVYGLFRFVSAPANAGGTTLVSPDTYQSLMVPALLRSPADLLLAAIVGFGLVLIAASLVERARIARRGLRWSAADLPVVGGLGIHLVMGGLMAALLVALHRLTADTVAGSNVDLLHTSLHPWDPGRLALLAGLVVLSAAAIWGGVTLLLTGQLLWDRRARTTPVRLCVVGAWMLPALLLVTTGMPAPTAPFVLVAALSVGAAMLMPSVRPWFRHGSQASRMLTLFVALLAPALAMYPSLQYYADQGKRTLVETRYAQQAATHPTELQTFLQTALAEIDQIPELEGMTAPKTYPTQTDTDRAFFVWRQTTLAELRLTSAVELYDADGTLVSRFALNFPEYAGQPRDWQIGHCDWEIFGEVAPFGAEERRLLHAERGLCVPEPEEETGRSEGAVVVHVALDYQALPFISPQSPYAALLRQDPQVDEEGLAGQDVELVIYGWGRQPIFSSAPDAWLLDDALFSEIYASREPFWARRAKGGREYEVFVLNNRSGIYALGYPVFGLFDHAVRLAEIVALVGLVFAGFVLLTIGGSALTRSRYRIGRALLREIRTSFYRRLFLAFVAATVIPVLALALVIRNYFAAQLRADVEQGAARTAAVAQRVIQEAVGLQQTGDGPAAVINDDLLVWISQIIDQDVNIFEGSQLQATSERDLFASGLLPTRTPDAVYAAITLERMPSYVGEDAIGPVRHLVAATPIRTGDRDAILTVPLVSRQQEIEQEIDDLDRGILLGVTLFILFGAGGGFYLAERIADPVKRLTRATGQIARGNFDAQVAVKSADELQRLVMAFNKMAVDLKNHQQTLERTHRLEAWAEMARQVAHEIKNPLTPVQLSAEHLLQVHRDRGEPLSPVLQTCVDSILSQVRILRQISAEFSSYASSPPVNPEPTSLATLVEGVVKPYRVGLEDRIRVSIDIPDTLPPLFLDRTLVGRALTNIVENALHAMPGQGTLTIRAVPSATHVALVVTDTGVGVDKATLQRIFEPYFSTKVSGTGLGMAIAKRNIELNGGTIAVDSVKDQGTTVTLTFPRDAAPGGGDR